MGESDQAVESVRDKLSAERERMKKLEKSLQKRTAKEQDVLLEIEEHSVSAQNVVGKKQALQDKLALYSKYIHELGALDTATVAKYADKSRDSLSRSLKKLQKDLEKF